MDKAVLEIAYDVVSEQLREAKAMGASLVRRVAELEEFIQENVECQCSPVRVCARCAIATKPHLSRIDLDPKEKNMTPEMKAYLQMPNCPAPRTLDIDGPVPDLNPRSTSSLIDSSPALCPTACAQTCAQTCAPPARDRGVSGPTS